MFVASCFHKTFAFISSSYLDQLESRFTTPTAHCMRKPRDNVIPSADKFDIYVHTYDRIDEFVRSFSPYRTVACFTDSSSHPRKLHKIKVYCPQCAQFENRCGLNILPNCGIFRKVSDGFSPHDIVYTTHFFSPFSGTHNVTELK